MKTIIQIISLVLLISLSACSFSGRGGSLEEARSEVATLQKSDRVLKYAPAELKQAEDALIAAVNAWNSGRRSESDQFVEVALEKVALTKETVKKEAALGLDDEAWEQRRWLREVRNKRLSSSNN